MAIKLNDEVLEEIGLAELPGEHKPVMLRYIYETLEQRVGLGLAGRMSNDQMDAFKRLIDASDQERAKAWLVKELPDYQELVQQEFTKVKGELATQAARLVEVSRTHPTINKQVG